MGIEFGFCVIQIVTEISGMIVVQYYFLFLCTITMLLKIGKTSETLPQKIKDKKMELDGKTTNFATCFTIVKKKS